MASLLLQTSITIPCFLNSNRSFSPQFSPQIGSISFSSKLSFTKDCEFVSCYNNSFEFFGATSNLRDGIVAELKRDRKPLNIMISGAPASGKGTQCELIKTKYGLTHISTGDILRAEVAAETGYGRKAKAFMDQGKLVPDEIIITMVKERLTLPDVKEVGWLLDGFPRSLSQANALEALNIRPQLFILLQVDPETLVKRVVGRRLDPVNGRIYHMEYSPPESSEISQRLVQRSDDTEEKVRNRLQTYNQNLESILSVYEPIIKRVDGNRSKEEVFAEIDGLIQEVISKPAKQDSWRGVPTKLNNIPHSREIREYFYKEVCEATNNAIQDGFRKLEINISIPELDTETDVYRIGTLMELVRELAFTFANDGKRIKVCVQGAMGKGIFRGMPLQLAGSRKILDIMDWGEYGAKGTFVNIGSIGAEEVEETDDMFILMAPQNSIGNCIIEDLREMVKAVGDRPIILVNPKLKDLPSSGGVMQVRGREERMEFAESFFGCYSFKLLFYVGTPYPIKGAYRHKYPGGHEIYKRLDDEYGNERYVLLSTFKQAPSSVDIEDAFRGRLRKERPKNIWASFTKWLYDV